MAVITASAAGGNWNTNGAWVGGVQPTTADDVLITGTSGNIAIPAGVTGNARSVDFTGYTGTFSMPSSTAVLVVGDAGGGNLTFVAGMTVSLTGTPNIQLRGTGATTYTLTSAGKTLPSISVIAGAGTSTYQLQDNLTLSTTGVLGLTSGTLDTNGKTVAASSFGSSGASTRTLTLGASSLTFSGTTPWDTGNSSNMTFTANTATVTTTSSVTTFNAGTNTNFNGMTLVMTGLNESLITGTGGTFGNLTRTGGAALDSILTFAGNFTVSGTLTLTGNSSANRLWVRSSVAGTQRTITVNTTVTASRADFEDIVGAGSASWNLAGITDGSGDIANNSGITFTTATTKFAVATGNWSVAATWSLTSGGAGGAPYPLSQDDVVLDAASGAITVTMNMMRHAMDITATGFTGTLTMANNTVQRYIYGSLTLGAGMTFTATGNFTFAGRGSHTIDMAGKSFTAASSRSIQIGRFGGTYTLTSHANFGVLTTVIAGLNILGVGTTFDAAGFNVTANAVVAAASIVNMGSGVWTLGSTATGSIWFASGATINAGTSNIVIANASTNTRTFTGDGKVYNDLTYTVAGSTGGLDITGANTFHDLNFSDVTNARTLRFTAATTTTFTGAFNVNGTAGKLMTVGSITAANHTLTKASGTVASDYLSVSRSQAGGGAAWYAGPLTHSTDGGNNTGWIFTAAPLTQGNFFLLF